MSSDDDRKANEVLDVFLQAFANKVLEAAWLKQETEHERNQEHMRAWRRKIMEKKRRDAAYEDV